MEKSAAVAAPYVLYSLSVDCRGFFVFFSLFFLHIASD